MTDTAKHAYRRPPSSAKRYLSCHGSPYVVPYYKNDESDASLKGDEAHAALEFALKLGSYLPHEDETVNDGVDIAKEWVEQQRTVYGKDCTLHVEERLQIPETEEFGTCDILLVSPRLLHLADYKNGYVPVPVKMNAQMMTYLLGAIARFGERTAYKITVIQPNYDHIDGPIRTYDVTADDVEWFRAETLAAMRSDRFSAGKHCKETYCPHRGSCKTFIEYAKTANEHAWFTSEINSITDDELVAALDHAEVLQGLRNELRAEALRRIVNMDRKLDGFKVVQGRRDRTITDFDSVKQELTERLEIPPQSLLEPGKFISPKAIEDLIKKYARANGLPRGGWKKIWDNTVGQYITQSSGGLTLERAIDGRVAYRRGGEFSSLVPDQIGKIDIVL